MSLDATDKRGDALRALALRLTDEQTTAIRLEELGDLASDLGPLIAAGVLVERAGSVRFSHDTLLDHVAARAFVEHGRSLHSEVLAHSQELSRRPLIRRILSFERDADRRRYRESARALIEDPRVRFHLRDVVFDVLRQDADPEPDDWDLIEPMVLDEDHENHTAAWNVAIQPAYLRVIDRTITLLRWMTSKEEADWNRAASLLRHLQRSDPARAAVLMAPFLALGEHWVLRIRWVLSAASPEEDRSLMEFMLAALRAGVFDGPEAGDSLWFAAHELPSKRPRWGVELFEVYLRRAVERAAGSNPFEAEIDNRSDYVGRFARSIARRAPGPFARAILPLVIEIVEATAAPGPGFLQGDPWAMRHATPGHGTDDALFEAVDEALRNISEKRTNMYRGLASVLAKRSDFHSLRFLLYRSWATNPKDFWRAAIDHFLVDNNTFECGYLDSPYWVTRELIEAVQAHAAPDLLRELERRILGFYPEYERQQDGRRQRGFTQLTLLDAFDERRLSEEGRRRREELRRKFGPSEVAAPRGIQTGFVGSPIPDDKARKMTDRSWLRALSRYDSDEGSGADFLKGGAVQLSRVLEQQTNLEPERFARLALHFPLDVNENYVDAVLRGLGSTEEHAAPQLLIDVLQHFFRMPGRPGGRWLRPVIAQLADKELPAEVLDIVIWHATESPDPDRDLWRKESAEDVEYYGGDPFTAGINTVRGAAAEAVSVLIWPSVDRLRYLMPALEHLARDRVVAVRVCAAIALRSAYRHDQSGAVSLFVELCDADDDLLAARPVEDFLSLATKTHLPQLCPILKRMLESELPVAQTAGGRQVALAALGDASATALVERAMAGPAATRIGVTQVAANNILNEEIGAVCAEWLSRFFDDDDPSVREETSHWVRQLGPTGVRGVKPLLFLYIASRAYQDDESHLLHALDESTVPIVDVALPALDRFVTHRRREMGDFQRRAAFSAMLASKLAVRSYTSADAPERREQALDIIDALLAAKLSDVRSFVESFD